MNQFLGSLALIPIEKILNGVIGRDSYIAKKISAFDTKCVEVVGSSPAFNLSLRFEDSRIKLSAIDSETLGIEADATISGRTDKLFGLLMMNSEGRALADAEIDISGDATLVQDLHRTIESLDIDWQDYLAPLLGDVISHELGELESQARGWGKSAGDNTRRSVRDYLIEEARLVPSALEVESFANRLDQARLNLDRATARAEQLERRISLLQETK